MNIELAVRIYEDRDHPLWEQARDVLLSHPETSLEMAADQWLAEWIVALFRPYPTFSISVDDPVDTAHAICDFTDVSFGRYGQAVFESMPWVERGIFIDSNFTVH